MPSTNGQRKCLLLGWGLILIAWSCTLFPNQETPPVHTYVLTLEASSFQHWPSCSSRHGTLLVSLPREEAGFDTPRIAYLMRPFEVKYYAYNRWAESPGRLILPLLVQGMAKTDCWNHVAARNSGAAGDYRLDTEILEWQQEFFGDPNRMRLSIRAQLVRTDNGQVAAVKNFAVVEKTPSSDAYGAVMATNRGVKALLMEMAEWIKTQDATGKLGP
jgi:cholesterol transport system auxiliary component